MFLTRDQILAKTTRRYTVCNDVRLQSLNELELSTLRGIWAARYGENTKVVDLASRRELLVMCIVDEDGQRIFGNEEIAALGALDGAFIETLYDTAAIHTGMRQDEEKKVSKMEKKSESTAD